MDDYNEYYRKKQILKLSEEKLKAEKEIDQLKNKIEKINTKIKKLKFDRTS